MAVPLIAVPLQACRDVCAIEAQSFRLANRSVHLMGSMTPDFVHAELPANIDHPRSSIDRPR